MLKRKGNISNGKTYQECRGIHGSVSVGSCQLSMGRKSLRPLPPHGSRIAGAEGAHRGALPRPLQAIRVGPPAPECTAAPLSS
jgi:hypothetical protein